MGPMATPTSAQPPISPTALRNDPHPATSFELFRKLRCPAERPVPVAVEQGELPESLRAGVAERYLVAQLGGARPGEPSLDVTLFVLSNAQQKSALVRGIAANWTRRYPGNHLLIFAVAGTTDGFSQLTFVNTERLGEGAQVRVKLRKLIVERSHPTRHDAETLNRIAL